MAEQQVQVEDHHAIGRDLGQRDGEIGGQHRLADAADRRKDDSDLAAHVAMRRADFLGQARIHRRLALDHDPQHAAHDPDVGGHQRVEVVFA